VITIIEFTPLELLQGSLTLGFVVISTFLGLLIMIKYRKIKLKVLLFVGISWILLMSPYWPDAINFIMGLSIGELLNHQTYFFLANGLIPIVHVTWLFAFTELLYKNKQRLIVLIFTIEAIMFEIFFLYFLFTIPEQIGTQMAPFYVEWTDFIVFYLLFSIIVFLATGLLFAGKSIRSENEEVRLKGKFLLIAFVSFAIGTFIDAIGGLTEITLVLARTFVTIGAIMFYIGFILPRFVKNVFIREE